MNTALTNWGIVAAKFALLALILNPAAADAAQLVTCTGLNCNLCTLLSTINNITDWIAIISSILAAGVIVYAGFRLVTSGGDQAAYAQAKQYFVNGVIGLIIVLAAWTLVDTLIKTLAGGDMGVWNPPANCGGMTAPTPYESDGDGNAEGEPFDPEIDDEGEDGEGGDDGGGDPVTEQPWVTCVFCDDERAECEAGGGRPVNDFGGFFCVDDTGGADPTDGGGGGGADTPTDGTGGSVDTPTDGGGGGGSLDGVGALSTTVVYTVNAPANPAIGIDEADWNHGLTFRLAPGQPAGQASYEVIYTATGDTGVVGCRIMTPALC